MDRPGSIHPETGKLNDSDEEGGTRKIASLTWYGPTPTYLDPSNTDHRTAMSAL